MWLSRWPLRNRLCISMAKIQVARSKTRSSNIIEFDTKYFARRLQYNIHSICNSTSMKCAFHILYSPRIWMIYDFRNLTHFNICQAYLQFVCFVVHYHNEKNELIWMTYFVVHRRHIIRDVFSAYNLLHYYVERAHNKTVCWRNESSRQKR